MIPLKFLFLSIQTSVSFKNLFGIFNQQVAFIREILISAG